MSGELTTSCLPVISWGRLGWSVFKPFESQETAVNAHVRVCAGTLLAVLLGARLEERGGTG